MAVYTAHKASFLYSSQVGSIPAYSWVSSFCESRPHTVGHPDRTGLALIKKNGFLNVHGVIPTSLSLFTYTESIIS